MTYEKWLDTLIEEKGLDKEMNIIEVEGNSGTNYIPLGCLVEVINQASAAEKAQIKNTLVLIDFKNGDIMHFFRHLAQAIAI